MLDCDTHRTSHGVYHVPSKDLFINGSFKSGKHWENDIINFLKTLFSNMDTCDMISVGSHVGTTCIPLARLFNRIYAFEAQSNMHEILLENIRINRADNITAFHKAVCKTTNSIISMSNKDVHGNHLNGEGNINYGGVSIGLGGEYVETISLDNFCSQEDVNPTFISIDAEGSEQSVILSALDVIVRYKPIIMVEMNYVKQTEDMCKSLNTSETIDINTFLIHNNYATAIDLGDYNFLYIPNSRTTLNGISYTDMNDTLHTFTDTNVGNHSYYHVDNNNIIVIFNGTYLQHGILVDDKIMWNNGTHWLRE